jgi:cold shock CspA family protein
MTEVNQNYGAYLGSVNWFDTRKGYGFIRILNGEHVNKEIFIHQTNIMSDNYRVLFPGEYVSLDVLNNENSDETRRYQCQNVRGILGGPLLTDSPTHYYRVFEKEKVRMGRQPVNSTSTVDDDDDDDDDN